MMNVRVRSHVPRMFQLKSRRLTTGRVAPTSHVLFDSVPAFCHCVVKPSDDTVGTGRIWFFVSDVACVTSMPSRLKSVKSVPNSFSVVVSGFSFELPACPRLQPVALQLYVSYCALKLGVLPALPREARRRKSLIFDD